MLRYGHPLIFIRGQHPPECHRLLIDKLLTFYALRGVNMVQNIQKLDQQVKSMMKAMRKMPQMQNEG